MEVQLQATDTDSGQLAQQKNLLDLYGDTPWICGKSGGQNLENWLKPREDR